MTIETFHLSDISSHLTSSSDVVRATLSSSEDCILSGTDIFEESIQSLSSSINMQWFCENGDMIYKHQNIVSFSIKSEYFLQKIFSSSLQILSYLSGLATLTYCYVSTLKNTNSTNTKILAQRKEHWIAQEEKAIKHGQGEGAVYCIEDMGILFNLDLLKTQKDTVFFCRNSSTVEYLLDNLSSVSHRLALHNTMNWQDWISKIPNNIQVGLWGNIQCRDIAGFSNNQLDFIIPTGLSHPPSVDLFFKCP